MIKFIKFKSIKFLVFYLAFTVTVTVTDIEGCIGPFPSIVGPTEACTGENVTFGLEPLPPGPGPYSYSWTGPDGATSSTDTLTISNVQSNNAGTYTVAVTDLDNCTGFASTNLTVNSGPAVSINGPTQACIGENVTFQVAPLPPGGAPYSYSWTGPDGAISSTDTLTISNVQLINAGNYTVTVTDNDNCTGSALINLTVNPNPTASINGLNSVCEGNSITLTANTNAIFPSYQWFESGNLIIGATNSTFNTPANLALGDYNYTVEITDNSNDCVSTSDPFIVTVSNCAGEEINTNARISPLANFTTQASTASRINSSVLDELDRIIVGGSIDTELGANFILARYRSDGSLDPTFNLNPVGLESSGVVITGIGPRPTGFNNPGSDVARDIISSVAIYPGNKIVAAGTSFNGLANDFAIARYNFDGSLDITFNPRGLLSGIPGVVVNNIFGNNNNIATGVAVDSQGKIVVTGYTESAVNNNINAVLLKLNSDGTLDETFNPNGLISGTPGILISHFDIRTPFGDDFSISEDYSNALVIDTNDKITIAGSSSNRSGVGTNVLLARYNPDGTLDETFNPDGLISRIPGVVLTDISFNDVANSISFDNIGRILVTGRTGDGTNSNVFVARYNQNGTLDETFNPNGIYNLVFGSGNSSLNSNPNNLDNLRLRNFGPDNLNNPDNLRLRTLGSDNSDNSDYLDNLDNFDNFDNLQLRAFGPDNLNNSDNFRLRALGPDNPDNLDNPDDLRLRTSGIVITDVAGNFDIGNSITKDSNNKIIVSGYSTGKLLPNSPILNELKRISDTFFLTIRYNTDGSLDETFNNEEGLIPGIVLTTIDNSNEVTPSTVDNFTEAISSSFNQELPIVGRINPTDDQELSQASIVQSLRDNFRANSGLVTPDNSVITSGFSNSSFGNNFTLAKYTQEGDLDESFNPDGTNSGVPGIVISILGVPPTVQKNQLPAPPSSEIMSENLSETALISTDVQSEQEEGELTTFKRPVITSPSTGTFTRSSKIKLAGEAKEGALIKIFLDDTYIANINTSSEGKWKAVLNNIPEGAHKIYVSYTDPETDQTVNSDSISVLVDSNSVNRPTILTPKNNFKINNGYLNITGTADPGTKISVYLNKNLVGNALTNEQGIWKYKVDNIKDGQYTITTVSTDTDDSSSEFSDPVEFTVDTQIIAPPTITTPKNNFTVTGDSLLLKGTANPKSSVSILVDDKIFDLKNNKKVIADKSSNWEAELTELKLTPGVHTVQVMAESDFDDIDNKRLYSKTIDITVKPKQMSPVSFAAQGGGTLSLYLNGNYLTNINPNINNKSLRDYILTNHKGLKSGAYKLNYVFHDDKDQPRIIGEKIINI